jgi:hypothetical protein
MQEDMQEKEQRRREISNVHEKLQPTVLDPVEQEKIINEIVEELPRCRWEKPLQKIMLTGVYFKLLMRDAQQANEKFDYAVANGKPPELQMVENVKAVFRRVYENISSFGYTNNVAALVAAQTMTDVLMRRLSPAAFDEKKYAEFTNGYVLKHAAEFAEITGMDGTEPAFAAAKGKYAALQRKHIQVNEVNVIPENNIIAEPVENLPKVEVSQVKTN